MQAHSICGFVFGLMLPMLSYSQITDCNAALIKSTYNRIDVSNTDWRIASFVNEKEYEEIKRDAGASATIYGIPMGANYADFQKRVREKTNTYTESLTQNQVTNIMWTGLNSASSNAYSECLRARFSQRGLHLGVKSATKDEVVVWIVWTPRGDERTAKPEWQWNNVGADRLPKSVVAGDKVVVMPRPTKQQTLAVNFKGHADSIIIEPFPNSPIIAPTLYESFIEIYRSPEQIGWGKNFSLPYTLCTPEKPAGWTIEKVNLTLESARERTQCNSFTTCGGSETDTSTRVCRTTTVQGHENNKYSGYGTLNSVLTVTWNRPIK